MTYGWAILVVMIVGIVMWQLGIFNLGTGATTMDRLLKDKAATAAIRSKASTGAVNFMFHETVQAGR